MDYRRWAESPGGAEDALVVAVEEGEFRRGGGGRHEANALVPGYFCGLAEAEAGFVAAGDVEHPFFWSDAGGAGDEEGGVVVERHARDFGCGEGGGG